jgi:hypothetical protein
MHVFFTRCTFSYSITSPRCYENTAISASEGLGAVLPGIGAVLWCRVLNAVPVSRLSALPATTRCFGTSRCAVRRG